MNAIFNLRKSFNYVAALAAVFCMGSCGDDDEPKTKEVKIADVNGTYEGVLKSPEREASTPKINATVEEQKTLTIDNFPISDFLVAIEGEEAAAELLETIDDVEYEVEFTAKLNTAKDSVYITLSETLLVFSYEITAEEEDAEAVTKEVKVTLKSSENGSSYTSNKVLKANMTAEAIKVDDVPLENYVKKGLLIELTKK